jgi:nucleoside-diphosphate-sugar epimerase
MRIVIIGGTGHVGTYLVPRLVSAGHEVVCLSRGQRKPYHTHPAWNEVEIVTIDRDAAEQDDTFGQTLKSLRSDAVIDMICFTPQSAEHLVNALRGEVQCVLMCGTIWIHGHSIEVPTKEEHARNPFGEYGINKLKLTDYLLKEARTHQFPVTVLHPGHIVGPGWIPANPQGNFNPQVFTKLAKGEPLTFPTVGMETLHHVHADDVAQIFEQALSHWGNAVGEDFHVVSEAALTLRGYAEWVAAWFGKEVNLSYGASETWQVGLSDDDVQTSWEHMLHSPNCSISKAIKNLEYHPRYTSLQAVYEALQWLIEQQVIPYAMVS